MTARAEEPIAGLRHQLARVLEWEDAHAGLEAAVQNLEADLRGVRADGLPYSAWELLEHLRITQRDILDFCLPAPYSELRWPEQYWPATVAPPSATAWDESVAAYLGDRKELKRIVLDESIDLAALVPHATRPTQSYLRELLVAADHAAYHVGQLILVRRALGAWHATR